jgi:hypothetical protein
VLTNVFKVWLGLSKEGVIISASSLLVALSYLMKTDKAGYILGSLFY